jgi:hypothetical protein
VPKRETIEKRVENQVTRLVVKMEEKRKVELAKGLHLIKAFIYYDMDMSVVR